MIEQTMRDSGFDEVRIEQGPVLNELDIPLGIVTSINSSVRYLWTSRASPAMPAPRRWTGAATPHASATKVIARALHDLLA